MRKIKSVVGVIIALTFIFANLHAQNNMNNNSTFSPREKSIIAISALTAKGDLPKLRNELNRGLEVGLTVNQIKEVIVHLYAYCGFPRSIRGLQTLMEVLDERKAKGIEDLWGAEASPIQDERSKYERGKEVLGKLTGVTQDGPKTGYSAFAPEIEIFLKEHLFADIFERDVLTYAERELVTVSVIRSIGNAEPMLRSHLNICLNVGYTPNQLQEFESLIKSTIGENETNQIFPKGDLITNEYFKGNAWLKMLVTDKENFDLTAGNVIFERGARNNWHSHPGGQILLATKGKGFYQEKGKPIRLLNPGDVVEILPNIIHWHGATPDSKFEHLVISSQQSKGSVVWQEPVKDEEYNNF